MRSCFLWLAASSICAAQVTVVTDVTWRAGGDDADGWEQPAHPDESWPFAETVEGPARNGAHYTVANSLGIASETSWIWSGDDDVCRFRRRFIAPAGFRRAEMLFVADDIAEVWINGEPAEFYDSQKGSWGHRGCGVLVDLLPWIEEGANVIAVRVRNVGGPRGFAAVLRIDGEAFVPPVAAGARLTPEVTAEVKRLAPDLDGEEAGARDAATAALQKLARANGLKVVDLLRAELRDASPEALMRIGRVLEGALPDLSPTQDDDARFAFGPVSFEILNARLALPAENQGLCIRNVFGAQVLAHSDPDALRRALATAAADGNDVESMRAVRILSALELADQAEVLADVLHARPKTPAGAYAAAGLARMGGEAQLAALAAAARCGYGPTERAANASLRILKK
ncbi:MAG: hypothetical protein HYY18_17540 [Planctomycetes bacterium]|nr:hypothetical protein [Planctomycetota bacterium]